VIEVNQGKDYFSSVRGVYRIKGTIEMLTPFRIGSGRDTEYSLNQNPVLLRYDAESDVYEPFIPGSSIKGILRAATHRLAKTHGYEMNREEPVIVGEIFGNMEHAAKVKIRDASYAGEKLIFPKEDPKISVRGRKPHLRQEETLPPSEFSFEITVNNPTEEEMKMLLAALEEINRKRAHFGGSISRGRGFARVKYTVEKMNFGLSAEDLSWKEVSIQPEVSIKGPIPRGDDFSLYMGADNDRPYGCIVLHVNILTEQAFKMSGIDEPTVTVEDKPYIPGSVIKGHLRKKSGFRGEYEERIFGSTRGRGATRSRVLVSDFLIEEGDAYPDSIPEGVRLIGWIVLDNMKEDEIKKILSALNLDGTVTITGGTSAKGGVRNGPKKYNKISFEIVDAVKYNVNNPELEVEL